MYLLNVIAIVILLIATAFFVAAEFAMRNKSLLQESASGAIFLDTLVNKKVDGEWTTSKNSE